MKILFVCTGNTCRSPMANGFFRHMSEAAGLKVQSESVGTSVGDDSGANPLAVKATAAYGVDISGHKVKQITKEMLSEADRIYTMTKSHARTIVSTYPEFVGKISTLAARDIRDPFGGREDVYEVAAKEIFDAVCSIVGELKDESIA